MKSANPALPGEDGFCMRQQSRPGECLVRGGNSCTIWHLLKKGAINFRGCRLFSPCKRVGRDAGRKLQDYEN